MKTSEQYSTKRSWTIITVLLAVTVLLGSGLPKLETKNNYESDLPQDDRIIMQNRQVEDVFGKRDELIIVICAPDVLRPATLAKISAITEELKEIPGVVSYETLSLATADHIGWNNAELKVGPLMREIPSSQEAVEQLRREINKDVLLAGRLVSKDYTRAIILARLGEGYDQSTVAGEAEKIISRYAGPEKIYLLGDPIIGEEVDRAIERDVKKLFPIAVGLILCLFFLFFRTAQGLILPAGVIVLSVVWTMGLAGHIGYPLTVVSSAIPVLLVAVASSYGIHVLHSYRFYSGLEGSGDKSLFQAVKAIRLPVIITGITSAIGSATLLAFRITSIREFGVLTAAGFIFAMVLALSFVPAGVSLYRRNRGGDKFSSEKKSIVFERVLEIIAEIPFRSRKTVFILCSLIVVAAMFGAIRLRVGMDPLDYFPSDFPFTANVRDYDANFGGARKMFVMVEGLSKNVKSPQLLDKILSFQDAAEKDKAVGESFSFADVVKRINLVLHENDHSFNRIPQSEEEVAQIALLYSTAAEPEKFEGLVNQDYSKTKITLDVRTSDIEHHARLYHQLQDFAENIFGPDARIVFGGLMMIWIAQIWYIVIGKLLNVLLTLVLLMAVTTVVFRSWKLGLLAVLPVTIAMIINFGVMGFTGIRLNMATAIITAMGAGIGVDFAVHYLYRIRANLEKGMGLREAVNSTMQLSGKAILVDMISNVIGFAVFMISPFEPVRQFGWLICLTMFSSAAGALVLLPACIGFLERDIDDVKVSSPEIRQYVPVSV